MEGDVLDAGHGDRLLGQRYRTLSVARQQALRPTPPFHRETVFSPAVDAESRSSRERFETPRRVWEAAYRRFESPSAELKKFTRRLRRAGIASLRANSRVLELFSGRGGGVRALRALGFRQVTAVDLSPSLLAGGERPAILADCRALPCGSGTQDLVVIQGGLHHLPRLPEDLDRTLEESWRVLTLTGRIVIVEPWMTPFLGFVHFLCELPFVGRVSSRLEALATMIEHERPTYERWLTSRELIRSSLLRWFEPERWQTAFGKLLFVGKRLRTPVPSTLATSSES